MGLNISQRQILGESRYLLYAYIYNSLDFTTWVRPLTASLNKPFYQTMSKLTDLFIEKITTNTYSDVFSRSEPGRFNEAGSKFESLYDDVPPPYSTGFKSYFGYQLTTIRPLDVAPLLDHQFPRLDEIDCDYISNILLEIGLDMKHGYGYDPGQQDGLDLYLPAEAAIHPNLKVATRWLKKANVRIAQLPINGSTASTVTKTTIPYLKAEMMRPSTTFGRAQQAQKQYNDIRDKFRSKDFTKWQLDKVLPNGEHIRLYSDQLVPPYCNQFPTALGYALTHTEVKNVTQILDLHFPEPDRVDCDYLKDVFDEITGILNAGYLFSPEAGNGIDYYCGFGNYSNMSHASLDGIDTSNTRHKEASLPNIERARKWLARTEDVCGIATPVKPIVSEPENPAPTEKNGSTAPLVPTLSNDKPSALKWDKSVADLTELFYRLAKGGFINLAEYREPNGGNLSALCRHICLLFQVPTTKSKDAAAALKAALNTLLRGDEMKPGPIDERLLWKKPLDRRPGNAASARIAAVIPNDNDAEKP